MTKREAKDRVKAMGLTCRYTPEGELRVNYRGLDEATAYYTTDAEDAVKTAGAMAHARPAQSAIAGQ